MQDEGQRQNPQPDQSDRRDAPTGESRGPERCCGGRGPCCGSRRFRRRGGAAGEHRGVAALRHLDPNRVGRAGDEVVALQGTAQAPGLGPHHRVRLGVEAGGALEHRRGNRVAFQLVRVPGEGLLDQIAQEAARAFGDHELGAGEDTRKLGTHFVGRGD